MRRELFAALICIGAIGLARPVFAQTTIESFGASAWGSCSASTFYSAFSVDQAVYLETVGLTMLPPAGTPIDGAVYWSLSPTGPWDLIFNDQLTGVPVFSPLMNGDPGYLMSAVSAAASGSWPGQRSDGSAGTTTLTHGIGTLIGAAEVASFGGT